MADAEKLPDKTHAPSLAARLTLWFGIYLAAQLPLIKNVEVFWTYPLGLTNLLLFYNVPPWGGQAVVWVIMVLPYIIYLMHLGLSLAVTRKKFLFMMVLLIVIVSLNTVGCECPPPA